MKKNYNAEAQFDLLLKKMDLAEKEIDEPDRAELIRLYDGLFNEIKTKIKGMFPCMPEEVINNMTATLLAETTKHSIAGDTAVFSQN